MKIYNNIEGIGDTFPQVTLSIGMFDGIHKGHQRIIRKARQLADNYGIECALLTFEPHPRSILNPDRSPQRLSTLTVKHELLEKAGVDILVIQEFNLDFAAFDPDFFIDDFLFQYMDIRAVCVGRDFRFGSGGKGNIALLEELNSAHDCKTVIMDFENHDGRRISSTRIREQISAHNFTETELLLGHSYFIISNVIRGEGLGSKLGFPTANLELPKQLLPPPGVYAVQAEIEGTLYPAVANLGFKPTVGGKELGFEVHIIDFNGDLRDGHLKVVFRDFIREEQKFDSLEDLAFQINKDVETASELLNAMAKKA
jgi:riboflavin kinase / FMN adenylyltransferase